MIITILLILKRLGFTKFPKRLLSLIFEQTNNFGKKMLLYFEHYNTNSTHYIVCLYKYLLKLNSITADRITIRPILTEYKKVISIYTRGTNTINRKSTIFDIIKFSLNNIDYISYLSLILDNKSIGFLLNYIENIEYRSAIIFKRINEYLISIINDMNSSEENYFLANLKAIISGQISFICPKFKKTINFLREHKECLKLYFKEIEKNIIDKDWKIKQKKIIETIYKLYC